MFFKRKSPLPSTQQTARQVASKAIALRGSRAFSEAELAIGLTGFTLWLTGAVEPVSADQHLREANASAREYAVATMAFLCADRLVVEELQRAFQGFSPAAELDMAERKILRGGPLWSQWEFSLTRATVLLTRFFAYEVCMTTGFMQQVTEPDQDFFNSLAPRTPAEIGSVAMDWLCSAGLPKTADRFAAYNFNHYEKTIRLGLAMTAEV